MKNSPFTPSNRRDFFKKVFFYTSAGALVHALTRSVSAFAADLKLIDMSGKKRKDPENVACMNAAKNIGYVENLDAALKAKKIEKKDFSGPNNKVWKPNEQNCANCALYNIAKAKPAVATCAAIPGCLVHEKGSCNSWSPVS